MIVWRLCKKKYSLTALDGEGARLYGGRWNHKNTRLAYCSGTLSLAALEMLVHVDPASFPDDLVAIEIDLPDDVPRKTLRPHDLRSDWQANPSPDSLKDIGSQWARMRSEAVLVVPSVVVPQELNYLVNPDHPDAIRITATGSDAFQFDPRLFKP